MSLAKLFLSGLLIAGGLILGTFTLHGYFDPQWAQRQALAAGAGERAKEPRAINRFQGRSRFVSSRADPANAGVRPPAATPAGVAASNAIVKASQVKSTAKAPVKKKVAEKPKPPPQQASVWPWNLFAN
jgi:hypothetical protein